ncbi:glycoside hydrolase family 13 protein [Amycolatopsis sp. RTGN1]|uniref:glycoside hydrolase family 13 protein n=1 Tax=Amycolatopsis ponsaeliensis TaxID=2992142 RepID=UPI00254BA133|nr:glycoside hydrolase family 13 protein [Amycolatopsis sp. RTGN1]
MANTDGVAIERRRNDAGWWRQATVYQIYPRSFADANGDGVGDLEGVLSRIDHLDQLGIDAVWLSPFYPSALADGGYDVDDYRDVSPELGDLATFDRLVAALHERGIKVIVDIVPNHSSDRHRLFQDALAAAPGSPERDRYIFRDGTGLRGTEPPSDWNSFFGGPAWTRVPDGQWYLHLFAAEQPDWNWHHPDVRADFLRTLRFWGDRGVDGFRVDVAHLLAKDLPTELPSWAELTRGTDPADPAAPLYPAGHHPLWDRDELDEIYAQWRAVFDSYSPPLTAVAEAWVPAERRVRYASKQNLGQAFNFDLLETSWDAGRFGQIIRDNLGLAAKSGASSTWVFSNHDVVRHATRFGLPAGLSGRRWLLDGADPALEDRVTGLRRARAATLLAMALPGSMYFYQGEELGLPEVGDIPADRRQDPAFFRSKGTDLGRDGARVALPWTSTGVSFGFGDCAPPLPQPAWFADFSVERERDDPASTLSFYRRALRLRRELIQDETLEWLELGPDIVGFRRGGGWIAVTNFGPRPRPLPAGDVLLLSGEPLDTPGLLPADTTAWLRSDGHRS